MVKAIKLSSTEGLVELAPTSRSGDDVRFEIRVDSNLFCCSNVSAWVSGEKLEMFYRDLVELDRSLRGKAQIESMSPFDLFLSIEPTDSIGHMGVRGTVGKPVHGLDRIYWHAVQFGFEFEPQQLAPVVKSLSELIQSEGPK